MVEIHQKICEEGIRAVLAFLQAICSQRKARMLTCRRGELGEDQLETQSVVVNATSASQDLTEYADSKISP